ncbi:hypothetical protein BMF94_2521 [Rhodotorula taiwanensis]|uniref:Small ribosomal subunit protein mS33 n=1 Tax=Rhodotorula taiwanensis TaxID=741276 RepID=A0A2S5BC41_9BASI|nr:hypothetical protein BMF94_2521 [Rhodotorula taiwanensis]
MIFAVRSTAKQALTAATRRRFTASGSQLATAAAVNANSSTSTPSPAATRDAVASTSAIPYDPSTLPSPSRQQQLVDLRNSIFGTDDVSPHAQLERARDGSKVLKQRLQGPALLRWYGERYTSWKAWNQKFPGLDLVDLQEQQRLADLDARRKRGKVTPKKGQGRRATMKKK